MSDVGPRSDPHSGGQQRDPLAPPVGRRRRFRFSEIRLGANAAAAAAAGGVRRRPGSTTALRGLMASLALPSARPWRAMGMRDRPAGCAAARRACAALCAALGGRRAAADVDRLLVAIGRCWRSRLRPPRSNKPRDLRFGARFKPSPRAASPRPILRLAYAGRFSDALSICRTQQIARGLHTQHRERRNWCANADARRRFASGDEIKMLDSCRGDLSSNLLPRHLILPFVSRAESLVDCSVLQITFLLFFPEWEAAFWPVPRCALRDFRGAGAGFSRSIASAATKALSLTESESRGRLPLGIG